MAGQSAAEAIMTTTVPKTAVREGDGYGRGMASAGMLAPGLATMLVFITTDADVSAAARCGSAAPTSYFDRIDSMDACPRTTPSS